MKFHPSPFSHGPCDAKRRSSSLYRVFVTLFEDISCLRHDPKPHVPSARPGLVVFVLRLLSSLRATWIHRRHVRPSGCSRPEQQGQAQRRHVPWRRCATATGHRGRGLES